MQLWRLRETCRCRTASRTSRSSSIPQSRKKTPRLLNYSHTQFYPVDPGVPLPTRNLAILHDEALAPKTTRHSRTCAVKALSRVFVLNQRVASVENHAPRHVHRCLRLHEIPVGERFHGASLHGRTPTPVPRATFAASWPLPSLAARTPPTLQDPPPFPVSRILGRLRKRSVATR